MAGVKISELPAATTPLAGTELLAVVQGGVTKQASADAVSDAVLAEFAAANGSSLVGFLQDGVDADPRTVQSKLRDVVSVKDFGATGAGYPSDDRSAIQAAMDAAQNVYFPEGEYYISGSVSPQGNSIIWGAGRDSHIVIKDGDTNGIDLSNKTGVTVRDLKLSCRGTIGTLGGLNGKGAIYLSSSAQCTIENNFIFNCYNVGIRLYDSSNNKIRNNHFGDWYTTGTTNEDSGNIYCFGASSHNVIEGNFCLGANAGVGIAIHDYYLVGKQPIGNVVTNNVVDNKKAYGILLYTTTTGTPAGFDCRTVVSNNVVSNIFGDYVGGASGAGIYLQGGGGAVCIGNTVYRCCINTSNFGTLAMACITASITDGAGTAQILVANNHVYSLRGPGIWGASSTFFPIIIKGNTIRCDQTSGGDNNAIVLSNCDGSSVIGNTIKQVAGTAIYAWAASRINKRNTIEGNNIETGGTGLFVEPITGGSWQNLIVANNNVYSGDTGINASSITGLQLSNNVIDANLYPLFVSNIPKAKASNNRFICRNGAGLIIIGGTNTGAVFDETNTYDGTLQDGSTGGVLAFYASAIPSGSSTYAVGGRAIMSVPVVGQPKGWRCTVAGTPGTWVSEGNL